MLSFIELTGAGKMAATRSFRFTLVFSVVGLVYLAMVMLASFFFMWIEKKLAIPGFETSRD
jgi:polar amino acid transport system permease protein